jgi:hypothetical protein
VEGVAVSMLGVVMAALVSTGLVVSLVLGARQAVNAVAVRTSTRAIKAVFFMIFLLNIWIQWYYDRNGHIYAGNFRLNEWLA